MKDFLIAIGSVGFSFSLAICIFLEAPTAKPDRPPHIPLPMYAYQDDDRHLDGYLILPLPKTEWCSRVDAYFSIVEGESENAIPNGAQFANCMLGGLVVPSPRRSNCDLADNNMCMVARE